MCNPSLMYAASTAAQVGGAVVSGMAASQQAKTEAKVADANAAASATQTAADEAQQRRDAARVIGQSRVDYATAGVGLSSGTALDMLAQQSAEAELEALKIRAGGQAQTTNYKNQARVARSGIGGAWVSSGFNAASGLLSGATAWQEYNQNQKLLQAKGLD